jgi:hypothetical protein
MADPAELTRVPEPLRPAADARTPARNVDAEHGTTGWNAYEVWRKRVFDAGVAPGDKAHDER